MEHYRHCDKEKALGSGAFGTCKLALEPRYGRRVVVKHVARKYEQLLRDEWNVHSRLFHPFIIEAYALVDDPRDSHVRLVLEHACGGDLRALLNQANAKQQPLKHKLIFDYTTQLAMALDYLHDHCILHRDLKPENVLLTGDQKMVRLCDFGVACDWKRAPKELQDFTGTPAYMSPEVLSKSLVPNGLADMWSLGCIVYEMFEGKKAFGSAMSRMAIQQASSPLLTVSFAPMSPKTPELAVFIVSRLIIEAGIRYSAKELLALPYFKEKVRKICAQSGVPS
ncbi:Protein kinase domain-containing protein [Aphelenchoides fujianensis]|nr:Protein kinase domain-containing protein [Aphelenchoides fujianensis]